MQQTLLAFLALLIATLLSFSQQQSSVQNQRQVVSAELQQMALGVGMQAMEVIRSRQFDQNVSAGGDGYTDASEFTDLDDFGVSGDCELHPNGDGKDCNFVESFDGTTADVPHPLPDGNTYPFEVDVDVRYVCSNLEPANGKNCVPPTSRKEVILKIQDKESRLPEIRYTEVITYP